MERCCIDGAVPSLASRNTRFIVDIFELYISGMSIPEVSVKTGIPLSTIRFRLKKAGILRTRADGVRSAALRGRMSANKGVARTFSDQWKKNISIGKVRHADVNADGVSLKKLGYVVFTRGRNKGRSVHIVVIEDRIGRKLFKDECVHHIDGDKSNNLDNNLCLLTTSGHARLHRLLDKLAGKTRKRNKDGRLS
jgi:predicted RNA-binding protein with TRAM domain